MGIMEKVPNGTSCHTGNLNNGDGSISISGLPLGYTPGHTYDLALTIAGTNSRGYGFQLLPKANGSVSGSLTAVSSGMEIDSGAAEHRGTSSSGVWNFQWTAPSTDVGNVTFFASGLATGGSSGNDGDFVYTLSTNLPAFVNSTPTALNSTAPLTIAENQPIGSIVGEFNATDPDVNASLTYSLVTVLEMEIIHCLLWKQMEP